MDRQAPKFKVGDEVILTDGDIDQFCVVAEAVWDSGWHYKVCEKDTDVEFVAEESGFLKGNEDTPFIDLMRQRFKGMTASEVFEQVAKCAEIFGEVSVDQTYEKIFLLIMPNDSEKAMESNRMFLEWLLK